MKKLLFLFLLFACIGVFGQRYPTTITITVPSGTDTTITTSFWSGYSWSTHYWYESLDDTDGTLAVYGSNFDDDSTAFTLLWVDQNLDGSNDLPKTLSDTSYVLWGESFPFRFIIHKFTKGSNTAGRINVDGRRQ